MQASHTVYFGNKYRGDIYEQTQNKHVLARGQLKRYMRRHSRLHLWSKEKL
jgi:hypothetical protein